MSAAGVVSGIPTAVTLNTPFLVSVADAAFGQDTRAVHLDIVAPLVDQANPNSHFTNGDYFEGA